MALGYGYGGGWLGSSIITLLTYMHTRLKIKRNMLQKKSPLERLTQQRRL